MRQRAQGVARPTLNASLSVLAGVMAAALAWAWVAADRAVPSNLPPEPAHLSAVRLGTPKPAPYGTSGFTFLETQPGSDTPVTFDPCRPVHYVVRPDHAPMGGDSLLRDAIAQVSDATGLRFVPDGTTDEPPSGTSRPAYQPQRYGRRWAPVLITWSTPAETTELTDGVLGRAGPISWGASSGRPLRYVSGAAVFSGPQLQHLLDTGREQWARAVLLHELGHLVGLAHVDDPYQVMYASNASPLDSYRDGDRRGLEQLGSGRCYPGP